MFAGPSCPTHDGYALEPPPPPPPGEEQEEEEEEGFSEQAEKISCAGVSAR